ncbi:metal ABC transporter permease [Verrucomicrobiaceae bacterium N1E253]|uniref:Metal ABC transporter permease n=1 Tax=Oceaniferula marina TaxID=2748318 RepID=A0A851GN53_9BACT|nr:metal ABC transporter permease [Oceaniferula marina]NWK56565.1 metal ABC transporter permease [Oceaniferula marina]
MSVYLNQPWEVFGIGALWLVLMAFFVALPCSQLGSFLMLRRMSLTGDAISHSVFPGVVLAFLLTGDLASPWLIIGAGLAGLLATVLIELVHKWTRVKQDAATGISFTALFALGVVMMETMLGQHVDLDLDCVLHGRLGLLLEEDTVTCFGLAWPGLVVVMAAVAVAAQLLMAFFFRVLLLSSFDAGLAASLGYRPALVHYGLMLTTSMVVVAAFQSVGAILVIALLVLPGATAYLCTHRIRIMMVLAAIHALLSAIGGLYLHVWLNTNMSASVVVSGGILLVLAWLLGPVDGVIWKWMAEEPDQSEQGLDQATNSQPRD